MRAYAQTYASSSELFRDLSPAELYQNTQGAEEEVDETWEPTIFELLCYVEAVEAWAEYARYGMPFGGTIRGQPHRWRLAMDCIQGAQDAARQAASADAQYEQAAEYE